VVEICAILFDTALECWGYGLDALYKTEIYSRRLKLFICKYYDLQEKYFYFILLHVHAVLTIGSHVLVAVSTMIFSYVKHICGMFKIAR
jgi:hypothetical protein